LYLYDIFIITKKKIVISNDKFAFKIKQIKI
jgi:hypothetical protein